MLCVLCVVVCGVEPQHGGQGAPPWVLPGNGENLMVPRDFQGQPCTVACTAAEAAELATSVPYTASIAAIESWISPTNRSRLIARRREAQQSPCTATTKGGQRNGTEVTFDPSTKAPAGSESGLLWAETQS